MYCILSTGTVPHEHFTQGKHRPRRTYPCPERRFWLREQPYRSSSVRVLDDVLDTLFCAALMSDLPEIISRRRAYPTMFASSRTSRRVIPWSGQLMLNHVGTKQSTANLPRMPPNKKMSKVSPSSGLRSLDAAGSSKHTLSFLSAYISSIPLVSTLRPFAP